METSPHTTKLRKKNQRFFFLSKIFLSFLRSIFERMQREKMHSNKKRQATQHSGSVAQSFFAIICSCETKVSFRIYENFLVVKKFKKVVVVELASFQFFCQVKQVFNIDGGSFDSVLCFGNVCELFSEMSFEI